MHWLVFKGWDLAGGRGDISFSLKNISSNIYEQEKFHAQLS